MLSKGYRVATLGAHALSGRFSQARALRARRGLTVGMRAEAPPAFSRHRALSARGVAGRARAPDAEQQDARGARQKMRRVEPRPDANARGPEGRTTPLHGSPVASTQTPCLSSPVSSPIASRSTPSNVCRFVSHAACSSRDAPARAGRFPTASRADSRKRRPGAREAALLPRGGLRPRAPPCAPACRAPPGSRDDQETPVVDQGSDQGPPRRSRPAPGALYVIRTPPDRACTSRF
jgi:hypothetical protein